jgi:hypothetical protein
MSSRPLASGFHLTEPLPFVDDEVDLRLHFSVPMLPKLEALRDTIYEVSGFIGALVLPAGFEPVFQP